MRCTCPEDWQGMDHTAGCKSRALTVEEVDRAEADADLDYLEAVIERSKETRRSLIGRRKTSRAEAAEAVLVAFAPKMVREIRRLKRKK